MSDNIKRHLESAGVTFVSFFLLDLGTAVQGLSSQPVNTITWAVIWSLIVSAVRAAVKALWESRTPTV